MESKLGNPLGITISDLSRAPLRDLLWDSVWGSLDRSLETPLNVLLGRFLYDSLYTSSRNLLKDSLYRSQLESFLSQRNKKERYGKQIG